VTTQEMAVGERDGARREVGGVDLISLKDSTPDTAGACRFSVKKCGAQIRQSG
jgi:hypothetical protein